MVDMSAIASAIASLKAAKDIAETMIGLRDAAAFQQKQIEFQSKIIDANNAAFAAQDERSAMLQRIRELEEQMAKFKKWESEKQRYALVELSPGAFAYLVKPDARGAEPAHCICASCYQNDKKSILQFMLDHLGTAHVTCLSCKAEYTAHGEDPNFPIKLSG